MRFKCVAPFAIIVMLLAGTSCGIKIGGGSDSGQTLSLGGNTACLDGATDKVAKYLHGESSEQEIGALFDCATRSLSLFEHETSGAAVHGQYTAAELKKFLERYFLNNFRISDSLMAEIMQLKATLIGGDAQTLSTADLERAQALMQGLRSLSISMIPYISRLNPTDIAGLSPAELEQAIAGLKTGAKSLNQIIQANATPYTFDHLNNLLEQLIGFMDSNSDKQSLQTVVNYLPFVQQVKKIAISSGLEEDAVQMDKADWQNLLSVGADIYSLYLRYIFILKNDDSFVHGQGLEDLLKIAGSAKSLLEQMIARNGGQISFANIDKLLDSPAIPGIASYDQSNPSLFKIGSYDICRAHVTDFLRVVARRYMTDSGPAVSPLFPSSHFDVPTTTCLYPAAPTADTDGFTDKHIERFWKYVLYAVNGQRYLGAVFQHENPTSAAWTDEYSAITLHTPTLSELFAGNPTLEKDPVLQAAGTQLRNYLEETHLFPLFHGDTLRMSYGGYNGDRRHTFTELSLINALRAVIDFTFTAYIPHHTLGAVGSPSDISERMSELAQGANRADIEKFYLEARDLGRDIKIFDPIADPIVSADKRFMEASLFTFHSNGSSYMTVEEASDYIATLVSTKLMSNEIYSQIKADCPNGPIDDFGNPSVAVSCFQEKFYHEFNASYWRESFPGLYAYYNSLPSRPLKSAEPVSGKTGAQAVDSTVYRETFTCLLDQVSRANPPPEGANWVDSGDIDQYSAISHYIEDLFTRFDVNGDGFLDFDESMQIFPLVDPLLISAQKTAKPGNPLGSLNTDYRRLAAMTYMLKTGNIPSTVDFIWWDVEDYANFNDWFNHDNHSSWQFKADRSRVLQIINLISAVESTSTGGSLTVDTQACFKY